MSVGDEEFSCAYFARCVGAEGYEASFSSDGEWSYAAWFGDFDTCYSAM